MKRRRTNIGGSHTVVTYPPLDVLDDINPKKIINSCKKESNWNLYFHIAFCEFLCGFCHYDTTFNRTDEASPKVNSYLNALFKEIDFWKPKISNQVDSIYIGGGTPSVLSANKIEELFNKIGSWSSSDSICFETSPLTISEPSGCYKLQKLKELNVNRLSIGVQTFSEKVLRITRKETVKQLHTALEKIVNIDIPFNIDLIQDLPLQTEEDLVIDLKNIEKYSPNQVTWYTLRLNPGTQWYTRLNNEDMVLPKSKESVKRRRFIISEMKKIGYKASAGGRFYKMDYVDIYKSVRAGTDSNLLGMGTSAYSHNSKYIFRNSVSGKGKVGIQTYETKIAKYGHAITSGYSISDYEKSASKMVKGVRYGVNLNDLKSEKYLDELNENRIIEKLLDKGFIKNNNGLIKISDKGLPFEEEICTIFYSNEIKEQLL